MLYFNSLLVLRYLIRKALYIKFFILKYLFHLLQWWIFLLKNVCHCIRWCPWLLSLLYLETVTAVELFNTPENNLFFHSQDILTSCWVFQLEVYFSKSLPFCCNFCTIWCYSLIFDSRSLKKTDLTPYLSLLRVAWNSSARVLGNQYYSWSLPALRWISGPLITAIFQQTCVPLGQAYWIIRSASCSNSSSDLLRRWYRSRPGFQARFRTDSVTEIRKMWTCWETSSSQLERFLIEWRFYVSISSFWFNLFAKGDLSIVGRLFKRSPKMTALKIHFNN